MSLAGLYRRSLAWSLAGSAGAAAFQFSQSVVFARFSAPSEAGDYVLAATVVGFLTPLSDMGLSQAVVQADEPEKLDLRRLVWLNAVLCAAAAGLLLLLAPVMAHFFGRPSLTGLLRFLAFGLVVTPFGVLQAGWMVRAMMFREIARMETVAGACSFAVVSVMAIRGYGAWSMAAGFLTRHVLGTFGAVWMVRGLENRGQGAGSKKENSAPVFSLIRFGLLDLSARWADFLSNYLDKLIVGKWLGATALGYYNLAFSLYTIPTGRLGYVVARVGFPAFARLNNDPEALRALYRQSTRQLVWVLYPLYIALAVFSDSVIWLLYGSEWRPAAPLLTAFGLAGLVRTLNVTLQQVARAKGRPDWVLRFMVWWTLGSNVFLCGFLWFWPTAESAAWSRVAAKVAVELVLIRWLGRKSGVVN